ncbi:hypothetical protein ACWGCW_25865 [Streptomyces sp. NPDC054933]
MTSRAAAGIALAIASTLLATAGIGVLAYGLQDRPAAVQHSTHTRISTPAPSRSLPPAPADAPSSSGRPAITERDRGAPSPSATGTAQTNPTGHEAIVVGDGPAGDAAIQKVLAAANPANLPPALEQQLTMLGQRVWLAQATGQGREAWPAYFRDSDASWTYTHVRIQAAIARRTPDGHAEVKLVWTGTDPTGETHEAEPATLHLLQGDSGWEPVQ